MDVARKSFTATGSEDRRWQGLVLASCVAGMVQHAASEFVSAGESFGAGAGWLWCRVLCCLWPCGVLLGTGNSLRVCRRGQMHGLRVEAWDSSTAPTHSPADLAACVPTRCMHPPLPSDPAAALSLSGHEDLRNGPTPERDYLIPEALKQAAAFRLSEGLAGEAQQLAARAAAGAQHAVSSTRGSTGGWREEAEPAGCCMQVLPARDPPIPSGPLPSSSHLPLINLPAGLPCLLQM